MSKQRKTGKIILLILAALLLLLLAAIGIFYLRISTPAALFTPDATAAPTPESATPSAAPLQTPGAHSPTPEPAVTPEPTPAPMSEAELESLSDLSFMKNRVNIMVFGIDKSEEREASGSFRTDTMILVTVNFKTNAVDMISIPRDSYVQLYNKSGRTDRAA